ncbi:hypothetical protein [Stakelama marina]|uniref:Uncharacterized protein n=1 Tax=Stakelama marina TaxID=2826939 RepID=A0A8T4IHL7_9SPHN|nr:hypothetical protein [Stakelama marina]MBR0554001.1 hypothetical protein [Stakelama marina]
MEAAETALPTALAVLMVGVASRQAASPTARLHANLIRSAARLPLAPRHGAFNAAVATALTAWQPR